MVRFGLSLIVFAGWSAAGLQSADVPPGDKAKPDGSCGRFGTQVAFVDTPSEAARQAAKEQKLVFVLHVSGLFEDPRLT
jgi:hypothetical protein